VIVFFYWNKTKMSENLLNPTDPPRPERKMHEIPNPVSVRGNKGRVWQDPIQGRSLMWKEMPPSHAVLTDWVPPDTEIALRMSDGDINLISVRDPQSRNNATRGYFLTNIAMNRGRSPGQPIRGIELSPEAVEGLVIERDRPLTVRNPDRGMTSEGTVVDIVTYDRTAAARTGQVPSHRIADDFLDEVGALPFVTQ
jgi:hypothetical protein